MLLYDVLFITKVDIPNILSKLSEENRQRREEQLAFIQVGVRQASRNFLIRVPPTTARTRAGWILHQTRTLADKQRLVALKQFLENNLPPAFDQIRPVCVTQFGARQDGLPIYKQRVTTYDPQTGETNTVIRRRKDEQGNDEPDDYPLDPDLLTFFLQPERDVDDGEGGTITIPAATDFNRIYDKPRLWAEQ